MNVAEQIVAQLVDAGVHRIYGIVGDSLNPIVDAVRKTGGSKKGGIDWISRPPRGGGGVRCFGRGSADWQARRVRGFMRPGQPAPHQRPVRREPHGRACPGHCLAHPERPDRLHLLPGNAPGPHLRGVPRFTTNSSPPRHSRRAP